MSTMYLSITPHDPIIARDGRPFGKGQGIRMRSLDWPYPSVLAGSLRTILGKLKGGFSEDIVTKLLEINIAGPLPMKGKEMFLPMPKDIIARVENRNLAAIPLRPVILGDGEGCDFPISGLLPAMIPESIDDDFKPKKLPAFWSMKKMIEWLSNPTGFNFVLCKDSKKEYDDTNRREDRKKELWHDDPDFLESPERDERVHTGIDAKTGASAVEEGLLFMSAALDLSTTGKGGSIRLAARIEADNVFEEMIRKLDEIHPFGGERRLAQWSRIDEPIGWNCPDMISSKLAGSNSGKIRMVLATPAIFSNGWLPGWMHLRTQEDGKEILEGIPPGATDGQKLKLVSACVDRWKPISGWSAEAKSRGPKAIRRMVPAGSVYFFEAQNGQEASSLAKSHWLESVCDKPQDCRDGFGLAVWGVWEEAKKEDNKDKR